MINIVLAADHGGYKLKEEIKKYLANNHEYRVNDLGTNSEDSVDYPEYGILAARAIQEGKADRAIVFCGTGIGISITANKFKGIRAANCCSPYMAEMSRRHNDANVLALGGRILSPDDAKKIVDVWLKTGYEGGRHQRRVEQIARAEEPKKKAKSTQAPIFIVAVIIFMAFLLYGLGYIFK